MTKIKICGLKRKEEIEYANIVLPEYIGFVFAKSKRQITGSTALELRKRLDSKILSVGVFVREEISRIKELCDANIIDLVQLHGEEDIGYMQALQIEINKPIVRAIRVKNTEDILKAEAFPCEFILLDTYVEQEAGGSGKMFDHGMIPKLKKPFFLAGGLHPDNVAEVVATVCPFAVDVSSGVEKNGIKEKETMADFIAAVRNRKEYEE